MVEYYLQTLFVKFAATSICITAKCLHYVKTQLQKKRLRQLHNGNSIYSIIFHKVKKLIPSFYNSKAYSNLIYFLTLIPTLIIYIVPDSNKYYTNLCIITEKYH